MGHFTELYGFIYGHGEHATENSASIAALPEHDTYPYLVRDMFAVPSMDHAYNEQLISFGLFYKSLETRWTQWLT